MITKYKVFDSKKTYIKDRRIRLYFTQPDVQNTFKRKCTFWNNVRFQKDVQNPLNPFISKALIRMVVKNQ